MRYEILFHMIGVPLPWLVPLVESSTDTENHLREFGFLYEVPTSSFITHQASVVVEAGVAKEMVPVGTSRERFIPEIAF